MTLLLNELPEDVICLIYEKLHRLCMREVRMELCGSDDNFFWLPQDKDTDTDESYSCYSSDIEEED